MFYQVRVPEKHQNFLRFLWWENINLDCKPSDHQMCVHVFGGTSWLSCCIFALKQTSTGNVEVFDPAAAETLERNLCVNDMLTSAQNKELAIKLVKNVVGICQKGRFKITKFISNSREILTTIPEETHHQKIKDQDLNIGVLPVERTLGAHWNIGNDYLGFRIKLKDKPLTRRGMLSTITSVYDTLGIAAPFVLERRKSLQKLFHLKLIGMKKYLTVWRKTGFVGEINYRNWKTLMWAGAINQIILVMSESWSSWLSGRVVKKAMVYVTLFISQCHRKIWNYPLFSSDRKI